jgi:hypothetical protein
VTKMLRMDPISLASGQALALMEGSSVKAYCQSSSNVNYTYSYDF